MDESNPNSGGLSRKAIEQELDNSLDRLGMDTVDLYQIHRWDDDTPVEETLSALDHLVEEGVVRYVGASTMPAWKFVRALYAADVDNRERFVSMQPEYNAVDRHEEANVLPACEAEGVGVLPWSPLAGGFLTGKYDRDGWETSAARAGREPSSFERKYLSAAAWAVLDAVQSVAD
jgi:aryl-alcohol dehydrogenase-like predicted oxidoreductase